MGRARDIIKYGLECYDKHACLKPSIFLIVAMVFACREYLLPLVVLLGSMKGNSFDIDFLLEEHHTLALALELPALLVIYAMIRRVPAGDRVARWAWKWGRALLALAVFLDIWLVVSFSELSMRHVTDEDLLTLARVVMDALIVGYLALSTRVKDTFADFPARAVPVGKAIPGAK